MSDLISRQGAINKCRTRLYESAVNNVGYKCDADKVFVDIAENRIETWLNELPSAQPEHMSWTLCRHQMPENNVNVLFCRVDGEIFVGHHFHLDNYWVTMGYAIPDNDVKAWMPLPEPYKGGEQDAEV